MKSFFKAFIILVVCCISLAGCVEETISIKSSPDQVNAVSLEPSSSPPIQVPETLPTDSTTGQHVTAIEESAGSGAIKQTKLSTLKPVYSVGKGSVAITIDDGPTKHTEKLLKVLREQNVHVTFFLLGQNVKTYPEAVTKAVHEGHVVGFHSNTHPQMTKMTYDEQKNEFDKGLAALRKWDTSPITLFRPPYGSYNNDTKLITEENQMKMVLWNEDPEDWSTTNSAKIAKKVLSQVKSGSIIVLHDNPATIAALPAVIKGIKSKGFKLITIPDQ